MLVYITSSCGFFSFDFSKEDIQEVFRTADLFATNFLRKADHNDLALEYFQVH
jgi:hypothetical protein